MAGGIKFSAADFNTGNSVGRLCGSSVTTKVHTEGKAK